MNRPHLLVAFVLAAALPVSAATHTWKGGGTGNWSTGSNWTGGVPTSNEAGATIVQFGSNISSTDNIPGLVVDEIIFTGGGNVIGGSTTLTLGANGFYQISNLAGTNAFAASLSLVTNAFYVNLPTGQVTINGDVSGSVGPSLVAPSPSGTGILLLLGTNSWTSTTFIAHGTLDINSAAIDGGIPLDVYVGDAMGAANTAVLRELSGSNIANSANVFVSTDGLFDLNGFTETIRGLAGPGGHVTLGSSGTLTLSPVGITSFGGVISGGGIVRKTGDFTQVLSGNSTYTGATDVIGGTLIINGAQPSSAVTVETGANLDGIGTTGPLTVNSNGTVSAGGVPPGPPNDGGPGVLTVTGALTLQAGSNLVVDLNGAAVGTGYDRIAATGPASIAGANLAVNVAGFVPTSGSTFTILTSSALSGTFSSEPEGAFVYTTNFLFTIHYSPTSVVLTTCDPAPNVTPPPAATVTQTLCQ